MRQESGDFGEQDALIGVSDLAGRLLQGRPKDSGRAAE